ncbi:MAG: glycoside-pentoside-hexuronide (GPH):cation symporter [Clostridiales bacterium]|jgi:melibiose permease/lactose/raffinose/galactose permease|nr:glycoside-pentoside-hexuronide (GPH):cation symporter [Clostridiales bacterium]
MEEYKRNRFTFGIGTIGRDMVYTMISMFLTFYLTDVVKAPTASLWRITGIILFARVFDALNDPVMGLVVDNTRTKFGKFKPWIAFGTFASGILAVFIFWDFDFAKGSVIALFGALYILWGIAYTTNDISYWSMLPSLSADQRERERIGSVARICANIGLFFVVAGIQPITAALGNVFGSRQRGYMAFVTIIVIIMWLGQLVTLLGVKESKSASSAEHTSIKELVDVIFKNDQLLFTAVSMALFMIGYVTTTSFGQYYFKYVYGDENMYSIFAVILGVSQIAALAVFPLLSNKLERSRLYLLAIVLVAAGYIIFFFAPTNTMLFIGIAGVLLFVGEAFIQLLMLMFLADSVDYGHWKLGKRNDSITFSLQPFINKMGGAISGAVVNSVIILSGIKDADSAAQVSQGGLFIMKSAMLLFPLVIIVISFIIYRSKYKIDRKMYEYIIWELEKRES